MVGNPLSQSILYKVAFKKLRKHTKGHESIANLSHEQKPLLLSIESWLVNKDPYNGLSYFIIIPI